LEGKQIRKKRSDVEIPSHFFIIMKQTNLDWRIVVAGIAAIAVIEVVALIKGVDGTLMLLTTAAIAGLAGYVIPSPVKLK
jgi:hypothetical protein